MFSLLPLKILYFPCYVEKSLDFKLERIFLKKFPRIFQSILCRMNKWNLCLSTNVLLFDDLTILVHNFVLHFSILSQKEKFKSKGKAILSQAAKCYFCVLCRMGTNFKSLLQCCPIFNSSEFFHCWKKVANCPSNMYLSDIITSSRISLIIFSIDEFVS